jgi:Tfp pilus assembly protein PilO
MPRNFNLQLPKDKVGLAKGAAGVLVLANLVAGYFLLYPPGGSPAELEQQIQTLRAQVLQRTLLLKQTRTNVQKIERGRGEGDQFMKNYFLTPRTASSTLVDELNRAAKEAKITPKEHSIQTEEIEGSDNLKMMTINGNYEGTYADLIQFVNRLDRSQRLMIIESLNATPQQGKGLLNINVKVDTFVRDEGTGL